MGQRLPQFDHVILLGGSVVLLVARLGSRTNNAYGNQLAEVARVVGLVETVEPLLRCVVDYEIDTSMPLTDVVVTVLDLTGAEAPSAQNSRKVA